MTDTHDIRYEGRAAFLTHIQPNTDEQKQRARRWVEAEAAAKAGDDVDRAVAELLAMVGLAVEGEQP